MLPGIGIVDMIQDKVSQLIRSEEWLGSLHRVDVVGVLLRVVRGTSSETASQPAHTRGNTHLILQPGQGGLDKLLDLGVLLSLVLVE